MSGSFPGSAHDMQVWQHARTGGFVLTTRDEDFIGLSVLRGAPPKVIWLNVGNARTAAIATLLQAHRDAIDQFASHEEYTFLAIGQGG